MQIVDNQVSEIIQSYVKIQKAENELQSKWRKPLLAVYAQQREKYEQDLVLYNRQRSEFSRRLRLGIWMATILLVLGILVLPGLLLINEIGDFRGPLFCFSPLLILSGLTGWAIIVVLWIWQRDQEKPRPPQNPLKIDLVYPLMPLWKEGLIGSLPKKKPHPAATGEFHLITRLQSLTDTSYILYGLHLIQGEDVDIILLGPKGIWVLEVIYLKGLIRWQNGEWSKLNSTRRLSVRQQQQVEKLDQAFDAKWQHASNEISELLRENDRLLKNIPSLAQKIRGGLVFAHPQGRYDIPPGCPFNWGVVPFWIEKFQSLPDIEGMNDYVIFSIMDILLERHRQIAEIERHRSMMNHAEKIVITADENIQKWMENNKIIE
jgi:hypothetical protein